MASRDTFTAEVPQEVSETNEYREWMDNADSTIETKVAAAVIKIESEGIVTNAKALGDGLYERKWKSGLRLYFAVVMKDGKQTLLLLGSLKGKEQARSIIKSKELLKKHDVFKGDIKKKD